MKRLVSLFLSLMILLCCVVPVSATGLDSSQDGNIIDITPYVTPSYLDTSSIASGSRTYFDIQFDQMLHIDYLTVIVRTDDTNPSFGSSFTNGLTVKKIDNELYLVYGPASVSFRDDLNFSYLKGNGTYINIVKFEVLPKDFFETNIVLTFMAEGSYQIINGNEYLDVPFDFLTYVGNDASITMIVDPDRNSDGSISHQSRSLFLTSWFYFDWTKYDRVDFYVYNSFDTLTDYAFYVDDINVLSSIQSSTIKGQSGTIITLDFTKLDPNVNSPNCYMRFRGYKTLNSAYRTQLFYVHATTGFFSVDSDNFWPSWLMKIIDKLDNIFTGRGQDQSAADSFNDSVADQSNELEDLTADLNSVTRPPLSDVNLSTGTMVDSGTIVLATSGLGSIMSNTIILRVLLMALTFALAGFILFGKR